MCTKRNSIFLIIIRLNKMDHSHSKLLLSAPCDKFTKHKTFILIHYFPGWPKIIIKKKVLGLTGGQGNLLTYIFVVVFFFFFFFWLMIGGWLP